MSNFFTDRQNKSVDAAHVLHVPVSYNYNFPHHLIIFNWSLCTILCFMNKNLVTSAPVTSISLRNHMSSYQSFANKTLILTTEIKHTISWKKVHHPNQWHPTLIAYIRIMQPLLILIPNRERFSPPLSFCFCTLVYSRSTPTHASILQRLFSNAASQPFILPSSRTDPNPARAPPPTQAAAFHGWLTDN